MMADRRCSSRRKLALDFGDNAYGTMDAFTSAWDGTTNSSGAVQVRVTAVSDAPTLTTVKPLAGASYRAVVCDVTRSVRTVGRSGCRGRCPLLPSSEIRMAR